MRVLFCGGGTAGHISPAIAMAQMLSESKYECECAFVGRSGGEENLPITSEGYKLYTIEIEGFRRRVSGQTIRSVLKVIKSLRAAREILDEYKPELIIGTGGYVCWPIIKAGISKKIKTVIHESNAEPGLVTRTLGPKCDAVLLNLDAAKNRLRGCRCVRVIGNPTRRGFETGSKEDCRKALSIARGDILIVSFGGSLGAKRLNDVVCEVCAIFPSPSV